MERESNELTPVGELTDGEREAVNRSAYKAEIDNIVAAERANWDAEALAELKSYKAPVTEEKAEAPARAAQILDRSGVEVHRLMSPTEPLYSRFSDEEKQWRSPDSDHWNAEWFRGQLSKNSARMARANAGLEEIYGRALMTEGAAGALGAIAGGTAGELMPRPMEQIVLLARDRVSKMRRFASHISMTSQTHTVPTAAAMTAHNTAEEVTATDGSPAIAQVQLTARKGQVTSLFTVELMQDNAINLVNMLAKRGGGALGVNEDNQFFKLGDGSAPNCSAFLASTAHSITTGDLRFTDVVEMYFGVSQEYRQQAVWLASANVLQMMTSFRNATTGTQFYLGLTDKPGPITDDPTAEGTVMRRPVYEVPFTDGTLWFGDPSAAYVIGTRVGITSAMSEHVHFNLDQVMWKMTQRYDGINVDLVAGQHALAIDLMLDT